MSKIDLSGAFGNSTSDDEQKEIEQVKKIAQQSGAPRFVVDKKEPQRQFNLGMIPESVLQTIDDMAHEHKTIRRVLILKALKAYGVDIPDELLQDRRRSN